MAIGENFSIVVVGAMNPRLHHPLWYQRIGLLTDADVAASQLLPLFVTPNFSQFTTADGVLIQCLPNQWIAQAADERLVERIATLAITSMDALDHTPIAGFGFNFDRCTPLPGVDVALAVAAGAEEIGFGFGPEIATATASISFSRTARVEGANLTATVTVTPSPVVPAGLLVKNNFDYRVLTLEEGGPAHFLMRNMIGNNLQQAAGESRVHLQRSVTALRHIVGAV